MNAHTPALTNVRPSELVAEYEEKLAAIPEALKEYESAATALNIAATIRGTFGTSINTGYIHETNLKASLLTSAWRHAYSLCQMDRLASAADKRRFEQSMANPAPFTLENIRETFGPYIADPRGSILRGLAEVFCSLDPAYKSHEKVKIGVKGLPKRVILSNVAGYSQWGRDRLENVLNALAAYQGLPLVEHHEINALLESEDALLSSYESEPAYKNGPVQKFHNRGVRLRRFNNGNGHLFFEPDTLADINRALAEYYGDVLADCAEEKSTKKQESTAVSKDLQYYPTPRAVVERVLSYLPNIKGKRVLEPSSGCGRFLDALRVAGADCEGIEVDGSRASACRAKGHKVLTANFLETVPTPVFDAVVMNPPFYGKHYAKHVRHAEKFLKPGGLLAAVLPITARYDHGLLDGSWHDLPTGSFAESGTNINTTVLTFWRADHA